MTSTLHRAVESAIRQIGQGVYGVACSGGADSLALADAAIEVAGAASVVVITIDHGLAAASAAIAARVATWARGRGAAAVVERVIVPQRASLEAAAREARYAALARIAERLGLAAVLTGHTARDQAETVLLRILRGTGPAGLSGVRSGTVFTSDPCRRAKSREHVAQDALINTVPDGPPGFLRTSTTQRSQVNTVPLVRPLLSLDRTDIDAYARDRGLPVWEDPMNSDPRFARVRVRTQILPMLRAENPQIDAALVRLAASASEWLDVIDASARPLATWPLDALALQQQLPAIRKRAVSIALDERGIEHDAAHLDAIDRVVMQPARGEVRVDVPGARLVRSYDRIELAAEDAAAPSLAVPDGPYELRVWRAGDRMRPARLKGRSRLLSDLFIDAKVPRAVRKNARVLVRTTDATIVWAEHLGTAFEEPETLVPKPVQLGGSF